jgi:16S rRNA C1402 (ribose-2'-O) methylase RsmI
MKLGFNITLVSDAGTPTISDPGYLLVNKCIQNNIEISSIPGPNGKIYIYIYNIYLIIISYFC